jgi:hypothetical protein
MKATIKVISCVLALSLTASFAQASCLTKVPASAEELSAQVGSARMNYASSLEIEKTYEELAKDANKTNIRAKAVLGAGVAPLAILLGLNFGIGGLLSSGTNAYLAKAVVLLAAGGYGLKKTASGLITFLGKTEVESEEIMKELRLKTQGERFTCSYSEIHASLNAARQEVMDTDMNGSVFHTIQDHVTLGSLAAKGTLKLYAIAALQREVRQAELQELESIPGMPKP